MLELRVMSLFDGIACGYEALKKVGIKVVVYYASEIDKYAIKIAKKNHPDIIELGDINNIDFTQFIGKIDLIMGGSPCQDLSIAGKRKGLTGERSGLFYKFVEAIETIKPKYFLLENNVGMPQEAYEEISRLLGCYPIEINSALVSAQTRKRFYWTNIGPQQYNLFGFPTVDIPQPKNKGILLKDILESGQPYQEKADCLTARYQGATFPHDYLRNQRTQVAEPIIYQLPRGNNDGGIKKDKVPTLTQSNWEYNNLCVEPLRIPENTVKGYAEIKLGEYMDLEPKRLGQIGKGGQGQRIYSINNKSIALSANGGGQGAKTGLYKIDLPDGEYLIRKLTPLECERLQTLPDGYTELGLSYYCRDIYDIINMVIKGEQQCKNVKLKDATTQYQTDKQDYAINIICDLSDMEQQNLQEILLKEKKNVLLRDVIICNKQERDIVLNIIKDLKEQGVLNCKKTNLKNVNIAIEWQLQEECVTSTIKIGCDTEMLNIQIKLEKEQINTDIENLKECIECNIEKLLPKYSEEILHHKKLYTILIWINLIIIRKIYMFAIKMNTLAYINSLIKLQGNLLNVELSNLKMVNIIPISTTQRYKCIGNGWTVDVIAHIFSFLEEK